MAQYLKKLLEILKIVLTGGPCAGKTTILNAIIDEFSKSKVLIAPEVATGIFEMGYPLAGRDISYSEHWLEELQRTIIPLQKYLESQLVEVARENGQSLIVCDRGKMDPAAYLLGGQKELAERFQIEADPTFAEYEMIIHLESLATANPALYDQLKLTNPHRRETLEQAEALEMRTREAWQGHPNWHFVSGKLSMEEKISEVINLLSVYLDKEVERRWILPKVPKIQLPQAKKIRQGYLYVDGRGELRIRETDNRHTMAVKGKDGVGGILRREFDRPIPAWVFDHLWPGTEGRQIFKDRYPIPYREHLLELDLYHERNQGHVKLECEFGTNEDPDDFTLPNWAADAREVTDDSRYNDQSVALHGVPKK